MIEKIKYWMTLCKMLIREKSEIPFMVKVLSLFLPIIDLPQNVTKGDVVKLNLKGDFKYLEQVTRTLDGYETVLVHIKNNWFKEILKYKEKNC